MTTVLSALPIAPSEEPTPTGQEPGGSGGGGGFASPPGAPSALKDISPVPSLPSVRFSERAGRVLGFRKEIVWDRDAQDFLMLLDTGSGPEPVGYARSWADADLTLDELIFAIRFETDTPGTFCPSCGDVLCEDAAICAACREGGE